MSLRLDFAKLISNLSLSLTHSIFHSLTLSLLSFYVGSQLHDGLINEFQFGPKHDLLKFTQDGKEKQRDREREGEIMIVWPKLAFIKPALLD